MNDTPNRNRRLRPQDPAIWVWAVVALMALVPLQQAVASHLVRKVARVEHASAAARPVADPATPADQAARTTGIGTP